MNNWWRLEKHANEYFQRSDFPPNILCDGTEYFTLASLPCAGPTAAGLTTACYGFRPSARSSLRLFRERTSCDFAKVHLNAARVPCQSRAKSSAMRRGGKAGKVFWKYSSHDRSLDYSRSSCPSMKCARDVRWPNLIFQARRGADP